jgi:hypothetical protein
MITLISAGELCQGCQIVKRCLEDIGIAFIEKDIRYLSQPEQAEIITNLRICNWDGKLEFDKDGHPILQAPILVTKDSALWSDFILPDGKNVRLEVLDVLKKMKEQEDKNISTHIENA